RAVRIVEPANHPRADAANIEPADLRLTQEEAVGQQDIVIARAAILEPANVAAFRAQREYPARHQLPVLGSVAAETGIPRGAAEAGEIEAADPAFTAGRADAVVERVVDQREPEDRLGPAADRIAQVAPGEQRFARPHAVTIE